MCRYGLRLGLPSNDAEDLAQEALLRVTRALHSFTQGLGFRAWLLKIASNCFIDGTRRRASRPEVAVGEPPLQAVTQENPGTFPESRELEQAVRRALSSLPKEERMVLVLRMHEGLSHRDIAKTLGKTETTVRWHLHQARKALRELLSDFL